MKGIEEGEVMDCKNCGKELIFEEIGKCWFHKNGGTRCMLHAEPEPSAREQCDECGIINPLGGIENGLCGDCSPEPSAPDKDLDDILYAQYEEEKADDEPSAPEPKRCHWKEDSDGIWHTDCGNLWQFTEGDPHENRTAFCPYCGGFAVAIGYSYRDEEPEPSGVAWCDKQSPRAIPQLQQVYTEQAERIAALEHRLNSYRVCIDDSDECRYAREGGDDEKNF